MEQILFEKNNSGFGDFPYISVCSNNLSFISHYHPELEIVYLKEGQITLFSDSQPIPLQEGDICIFMPWEIHSFLTKTFSKTSVIKINPAMFIEKFDFETTRLTDNKIDKNNKNYLTIQTAIEKMCQEYSQKEFGYEYAVRQYKNQLLLTILRNMPFYHADSTKNIDLLNQINHFLEQNYEKKINLSEAAKYCHLSKYYFAHKLKEITGMTFVQYVTVFRLEKVISFFKDPQLNITDIALKCGFGSIRSFNRSFLELYHTTPLKYRKQL